MTDERLEANRRNVTAFYRLMFDECRPKDAIDRYAGESYIQHNPPPFQAGRRGYCRYLWAWRGSYPATGYNSSPS